MTNIALTDDELAALRWKVVLFTRVGGQPAFGRVVHTSRWRGVTKIRVKFRGGRVYNLPEERILAIVEDQSVQP